MASKESPIKAKGKQMPPSLPASSSSKKAATLKPNEAGCPSATENPSVMKKSGPAGSNSRPPPPAIKPPSLPNPEKKKPTTAAPPPAKVPRQKSFVQMNNNKSSIVKERKQQPEAETTTKAPPRREKSFALQKMEKKEATPSESSPKALQRQRSFMMTQQSRSSPGGSNQASNRLSPGSSRSSATKNSPKFARSKTQSHSELPSFRRHRTSNSISSNYSDAPNSRNHASLNPQAKEFIMKKEVPGISPLVISGLSDQDKCTLFEAIQPPTASTRTKVRALLHMVDILMKAVLSKEESLSPANASVVCSKIMEADATETFCEGLLNGLLEYHHKATINCQELSRSFVMLVCEVYQLLKRRQWWGNLDESKLHLLSLLADWCQTFLISRAQGSKMTTNQIELLTHVVTLIGQDLRGSPKMSELLYYLRDAFLLGPNDDDKKGLLHLIELWACDWQLSPAAILYYFPQKPPAPIELPFVIVN